MSDTCQERVGGYGRDEKSRPCGKPVERDGLCKRHLGVAAKRAARHAEWNAEWRRGDELRAEAQRLSAALGIKVKADYSSMGKGGYTGDFIVPGEWLRSVAENAP